MAAGEDHASGGTDERAVKARARLRRGDGDRVHRVRRGERPHRGLAPQLGRVLGVGQDGSQLERRGGDPGRQGREGGGGMAEGWREFEREGGR